MFLDPRFQISRFTHSKGQVCVGQGDVRAAFDHLSLEVVCRALEYWRFDPHLVRALLEESLGLSATAVFPGAPPTQDFDFNSNIRQGGVEAPWEWNAVMRHFLALLSPRWEYKGYGIDLPYMRRLTHLVWADNIYFLSTETSHLQVMMQDFADVLVENGMTGNLALYKFCILDRYQTRMHSQ